MSYFQLLLVFFLCILVCLLVKWKKAVRNFQDIQWGPYIPIIGSGPYIENDSHKFFKQYREMAQRYNYFYVLWRLYYPFLLNGRTDFTEFILSGHKHITKSFHYKYLHNWLGTGLLTSTGPKWKRRRKQITPSFHFQILNEFELVIERHAEVLINKMNTLAENNTTFDMQFLVGLAMLDVICETAMGVCKNTQMDENCEYVRAIHGLTKDFENRCKSILLWPDFTFKLSQTGKSYFRNLKVLHDFTTQVINQRIQERTEGKVSDLPPTTKGAQTDHEHKDQSQTQNPKAFLELLLNLYFQGEIDIEGIREEVDTFMFEGHDTTAMGLSWTLYCLGKNKRVQDKLYEEIAQCHKEYLDLQREMLNSQEVSEIKTEVNDNNTTDSTIKIKQKLTDKIKNLKYLDFVIKEGLRLHPPVPVIGRVLEEDAVFKGKKFPSGTEIGIEIHNLHRNPEYWDDPDEFHPERFEEKKFLERNPYCYIPFSAGPRNCIGQRFAMLEMKITLYKIILNFELKSLQHESEVRMVFQSVHKSENGIIMSIMKRK